MKSYSGNASCHHSSLQQGSQHTFKTQANKQKERIRQAQKDLSDIQQYKPQSFVQEEETIEELIKRAKKEILKRQQRKTELQKAKEKAEHQMQKAKEKRRRQEQQREKQRRREEQQREKQLQEAMQKQYELKKNKMRLRNSLQELKQKQTEANKIDSQQISLEIEMMEKQLRFLEQAIKREEARQKNLSKWGEEEDENLGTQQRIARKREKQGDRKREELIEDNSLKLFEQAIKKNINQLKSWRSCLQELQQEQTNRFKKIVKSKLQKKSANEE